MGKSKAKRIRTPKIEVSKKESIQAKQIEKPTLPKSKKHKQGKSAKADSSALTIPLIAFALVAVLLGVLIVLASEHLKSRTSQTKPPNFKIIYDVNFPDASAKPNEEKQSETQATADQDFAHKQSNKFAAATSKNNVKKSLAGTGAAFNEEPVNSIESKILDKLENQELSSKVSQTVEDNQNHFDFDTKVARKQNKQLFQVEDGKQTKNFRRADSDSQGKQEVETNQTVHAVDQKKDYAKDKKIEQNNVIKHSKRISSEQFELQQDKVLKNKLSMKDNEESLSKNDFDPTKEQGNNASQFKHSVDKSAKLFNADDNSRNKLLKNDKTSSWQDYGGEINSIKNKNEKLDAFDHMQNELIGLPSKEKNEKGELIENESLISNDETMTHNAKILDNSEVVFESSQSVSEPDVGSTPDDGHVQLKSQYISLRKDLTSDNDEVMNADQNDLTSNEDEVTNTDQDDLTRDNDEVTNVDQNDLTSDSNEVMNADHDDLTSDDDEVMNVDQDNLTSNDDEVTNADDQDDLTSDVDEVNDANQDDLTNNNDEVTNVDQDDLTSDDDEVTNVNQNAQSKPNLRSFDEAAARIQKDDNQDLRKDKLDELEKLKETEAIYSVKQFDQTDKKIMTEVENKSSNEAEQSNTPNNPSASRDVSSNLTSNNSFTNNKILFFEKTHDQIGKNIDIIYEQLEDEIDDDETEDDEFQIPHETDLEEQSYRVEEKRVKIIKDSQFVPITDGVRKHILREGYGTAPKKGDQVTLQCLGYIDKTPPKLFWNTKELGQRPFKFIVGEKQVIKGWDEAVSSMKLQERSKFKIEAKKAYGKFGFGAWDIPPDTDLLMEFQLIDIQRSFLLKSRKTHRVSRNR